MNAAARTLVLCALVIASAGCSPVRSDPATSTATTVTNEPAGATPTADPGDDDPTDPADPTDPDDPDDPAGADVVDLTEVPSSASEVIIGVGADAAATVDEHPPGTTFRFAAGVHRGVSIAPRDGDVFLAEAGTTLSGAVPIAGFVPDGDLVAAPAPAPPDEAYGQCRPTTPACGHREELFVDGEALERVLDRGSVRRGTWWFDPAEARVVLSADPGDALAELSVATAAFESGARDVTIDGLVIEHYANHAQSGAINAVSGAENWLVRRCEVRRSHGTGIVVGDGSVIEGCVVADNGQQGVGATGTDVRVESNTITGNNRLGFDPGWSAGGAKFARIDGLEVTHNLVLENDGPGLWTDIDARNVLYEANEVHDNTGAGIFHEISYRAEIRGNDVTRNGSDSAGWLWGAGIQVAGSADVTIEANTVAGNRHGIVGIEQDRGSGELGAHHLDHLVVRGNTVRDSGQTGIVQDHGDQTVYERGHVFEDNTYEGDVSWSWGDREFGWDEWQDVGHDVEGTFEG